MQLAEALAVEVQRVEQLAVDVELDLVPGAVADPHRRASRASRAGGRASRSERSCSPPIPYMICSERSSARPPAALVMNETNSSASSGAGADVERLEREARVADPREAVVPVALAADGLGQRRRRRRDDRAGGAVRQALEDARAEAHELAVRAVVDVVLGLPRAPRLDGVVDAGAATSSGAVGRGRVARSGGAQRSAKPSASPARATANDARIVGVVDARAGRRSATSMRFGPPNVRAPPSLEADQRPDEPVLGPRRELHGASRPSPLTPSTQRRTSCGAS